VVPLPHITKYLEEEVVPSINLTLALLELQCSP